mgnify:CR=1 FL=1
MNQLGITPTFSIMALLLMSSFIPAFAEVKNFELDKTLYTKGDQIVFSGIGNRN